MSTAYNIPVFLIGTTQVIDRYNLVQVARTIRAFVMEPNKIKSENEQVKLQGGLKEFAYISQV